MIWLMQYKNRVGPNWYVTEDDPHNRHMVRAYHACSPSTKLRGSDVQRIDTNTIRVSTIVSKAKIYSGKDFCSTSCPDKDMQGLMEQMHNSKIIKQMIQQEVGETGRYSYALKAYMTASVEKERQKRVAKARQGGETVRVNSDAIASMYEKRGYQKIDFSDLEKRIGADFASRDSVDATNFAIQSTQSGRTVSDKLKGFNIMYGGRGKNTLSSMHGKWREEQLMKDLPDRLRRPLTMVELQDKEELCSHCPVDEYSRKSTSHNPTGCEGSHCKEAYESYLDEYREECLEYMKNNKDKKEGKVMSGMSKMFNFGDFGKVSSRLLAFSMFGTAIRTEDGNFVVYNKETKALTDVGDMVMEDMDMFFALPVQSVEVGDLIRVNSEYLYVDKINKDSLTCVSPATGEKKEKIVPSMMFGMTIYTKIISPMENMTMGVAGQEQSQSAGTNPFGAMMSNPMLMMMMLKDSDSGNGGMSSMMEMMMMSPMMSALGANLTPAPISKVDTEDKEKK